MPYGGGLSGMGGNSGMVMSLPEHDASLVEVVEEQDALGGVADIQLISPFAGKTFCFGKWQQSLDTLPLERVHATLYDNSNDPVFHERLKEYARQKLPAFTLVRDSNMVQTIESTANYRQIIHRCSQVYEHIYTNLLIPSCSLILNLEDDIGVPEGSFEKLEHTLKSDNQCATVIGKCRDRRVAVRGNKPQSISVNFQKIIQIGGAPSEKVEIEWAPEREWGVEQIGAGHMGFWLSRASAVRELGMKTSSRQDVLGHDIQWGLRVNEAGQRFAIDWSVDLKHYYQKAGEIVAC